MTSTSSSRAFLIIFLASTFIGMGLVCDYFPQMTQNYMKKTVDLATNEEIKTFWTKPPIDLQSYYWVYNVTNPNEFLEGEKAKLKKVGPFFFKSKMEKQIVEISKNNYRITYNATRVFSYNESTVGQQFDEPIYALNALLPSVLNGVVEKTKNMDPQQAQIMSMSAIKMAERFNETVILRTTPREMLLGRKSIFLQKALKLAQTLGGETMEGMPMDGIFGIVRNQNATWSGPVEVYSGHGETSDSLGNIIRVQGKQRSPFFEGPCSKIQVNAGELRPFPIGYNQTLEIYRHELGRVMHLRPTGLRKVREGIAITYVFDETDFKSPIGDPKRDCFCVNATTGNYCSLNGAIELGPVVNYAPLIFTIPSVEPDLRIRQSIANWAPELVDSHVDSVPDLDKTCQFLFLKILGLPVKADFTATLFIKVDRTNKTKSMANIPETSYIPMVMQRERIQVPEAFLAPIVHLSTMFEVTKHMKVVFYVSALVLIFPLTNLYFRQTSSLEDIDELRRTQSNRLQAGSSSNGGMGGGPGGGSAGNSLGASRKPSKGGPDGGDSSTMAAATLSGSAEEKSSSAFVVPVNIGNLTPELSGNLKNSSYNNRPVLGGGGGGNGQQQQPRRYSEMPASNAGLQRDLGAVKGDFGAALPGNIQQQQARFFSKIDEMRVGQQRGSITSIGSNKKVLQDRASFSVANSQQQLQQNNPTTTLQQQQQQQQQQRNDALNTNLRLSQETSGSSAAAFRLATGASGPKVAAITNDVLTGSSQAAGGSMLAAAAAAANGDQINLDFPVAAGDATTTTTTATNGLEGLAEGDGAAEDGLAGEDSQQKGGGRRLRHRNWFVKVYADVIRVLNDIKLSISTASQLDISERSDVHDKQLEMLAGRIDNWYGTGVPAELGGDDEFQVDLQDCNPSLPAAGSSNAAAAGVPAAGTTASINQSWNSNKSEPSTKNVFKREAPIEEESSLLIDNGQPKAPAGPQVRDMGAQGSNQLQAIATTTTTTTTNGGKVVTDQETQTIPSNNNADDQTTRTTANLDDDLMLMTGSADKTTTATSTTTTSNKQTNDQTATRTGGGLESPTKSFDELAATSSIDVESTTAAAEAEAVDKAEALQKLEQTIETMAGDQTDTNSLQSEFIEPQQQQQQQQQSNGTKGKDDQQQQKQTVGPEELAASELISAAIADAALAGSKPEEATADKADKTQVALGDEGDEEKKKKNVPNEPNVDDEEDKKANIMNASTLEYGTGSGSLLLGGNGSDGEDRDQNQDPGARLGAYMTDTLGPSVGLNASLSHGNTKKEKDKEEEDETSNQDDHDDEEVRPTKNSNKEDEYASVTRMKTTSGVKLDDERAYGTQKVTSKQEKLEQAPTKSDSDTDQAASGKERVESGADLLATINIDDQDRRAGDGDIDDDDRDLGPDGIDDDGTTGLDSGIKLDGDGDSAAEDISSSGAAGGGSNNNKGKISSTSGQILPLTNDGLATGSPFDHGHDHRHFHEEGDDAAAASLMEADGQNETNNNHHHHDDADGDLGLADVSSDLIPAKTTRGGDGAHDEVDQSSSSSSLGGDVSSSRTSMFKLEHVEPGTKPQANQDDPERATIGNDVDQNDNQNIDTNDNNDDDATSTRTGQVNSTKGNIGKIMTDGTTTPAMSSNTHRVKLNRNQNQNQNQNQSIATKIPTRRNEIMANANNAQTKPRANQQQQQRQQQSRKQQQHIISGGLKLNGKPANGNTKPLKSSSPTNQFGLVDESLTSIGEGDFSPVKGGQLGIIKSSNNLDKFKRQNATFRHQQAAQAS